MLLLATAAAGQTANLAVLWRRENGSMSTLWDQVSCSAVLAVNHFNARDGRIVPEFASVPAGLQLNGLYYDAWSTAKMSLIAYRNAIADGAHIIAGPSRSAQCLPSSQLAGIDEVVINSPWASSPRLSETAVHTHFARIWPSDSLTASLIMEAITDFGWRKVGYVGVLDGYAEGFKDAMNAWSINNADRAGGTAQLQSVKSFSFNNRAAARESVNLLKAVGANVNVLVIFDEDIYAVMEAMNEAGLLGSDYVTVVSDTTTTASTDSSYIPEGGSAELLAGWLRGVVRIAFSPALEKPPGFQRFAPIWSSLTPADCAFTSADNTGFTATQDVFDTEPWDVVATMYDAVATNALALATATDFTNGDAVKAALKGLTIDGVAGPLAFQDSLDRDTTGIGLSIGNFWVDPDYPNKVVERSVGSYVGGTGMQFTANITWRSGTVTDPTVLGWTLDKATGRVTDPNVPDTVPKDKSLDPLVCAPGQKNVGSVCLECEVGKYGTMPVRRSDGSTESACIYTANRYFAPVKAISKEAIDTNSSYSCPVRSLYQRRGELTNMLVSLVPQEGATSRADCTCEQGAYLGLNNSAAYSNSADGDVECKKCPVTQDDDEGAVCAGEFFPPIARIGFGLLDTAAATGGADAEEPPGTRNFIQCRHGSTTCKTIEDAQVKAKPSPESQL